MLLRPENSLRCWYEDTGGFLHEMPSANSRGSLASEQVTCQCKTIFGHIARLVQFICPSVVRLTHLSAVFPVITGNVVPVVQETDVLILSGKILAVPLLFCGARWFILVMVLRPSLAMQSWWWLLITSTTCYCAVGESSPAQQYQLTAVTLSDCLSLKPPTTSGSSSSSSLMFTGCQLNEQQLRDMLRECVLVTISSSRSHLSQPLSAARHSTSWLDVITTTKPAFCHYFYFHAFSIAKLCLLVHFLFCCSVLLVATSAVDDGRNSLFIVSSAM